MSTNEEKSVDPVDADSEPSGFPRGATADEITEIWKQAATGAASRLEKYHPAGTPLLEVLDGLAADNEGTPEAWLFIGGCDALRMSVNDPTGSILFSLARLIEAWRGRETALAASTTTQEQEA